jgi:rRNA maturation protein Nop10
MSSFKESYLYSVLNNKCPRCRKGNIYTSSSAYKLGQMTTMNETCPVCGQPTEIEVGFFYGTAYVSYALTVAFSVATFVAWWVLIGMSLDDNRFFWWMGTNAVLMILMQPLFMRLSRSIWLSWFVSYDPNSKERADKSDK